MEINSKTPKPTNDQAAPKAKSVNMGLNISKATEILNATTRHGSKDYEYGARDLFNALAKAHAFIDEVGEPSVGSAVISIESGWSGVVVRHVSASIDDRPHKMVPVVRWDKNGVETKMRPGRLKVYPLEEGVVLHPHDGKLALRHLKNLVLIETCSFWTARVLRPEGESCREYRSWEQGQPSPGCFHCEAVEFLKRVDPKFDHRR